jgi:NAD(P)-dependent dehydrogenase (short-subunit alcohol dehydrogenase family)
MEQRVCLVTGGSSGVGRAIAKGLARAGARVVIASRDPARGQAAAERIRGETGSSTVEYLPLDLGSPDAVRGFAERFTRGFPALHVLSNNAAALPLAASPGGSDPIFQTNYLGHFLLTGLLLGKLRESAPSRVVTVSGFPAALTRARPAFGSAADAADFHPLRSTLRAALAKALFSFELARRLAGSGVTSNTFHPGLVRSGLPAHLPWFLRLPLGALMALLPEECPTGTRLCLAPELERVTGALFVGRRAAVFRPSWDADAAARGLWALSERLTGITTGG